VARGDYDHLMDPRDVLLEHLLRDLRPGQTRTVTMCVDDVQNGRPLLTVRMDRDASQNAMVFTITRPWLTIEGEIGP
jgi:hypothetical protein